MRNLKHQNIIQLKEVSKDKKNILNVVMEYADGGELHEMICKRQLWQ